VSSNYVTVANRLFTAMMLVVLLIACQEMPDNDGLIDIQIEHQAD
jgi:hypothetical protein